MSRRFSLLMFTIGVIVVLWLPLVVSVDGFNFINSGRTLFTDDAREGYAWFREPGYPLLLKLNHGLFGSSDLFLAVSQGVALTLALTLVGSHLSDVESHKLRTKFYILALGALNPVFLGYASMVFRQAFYSLLLAIWIVLVARSLGSGQKQIARTFFGSLLVTAVGVSLSFHFLILGLVPNLVIFILWIRSRSGERSRLGVLRTAVKPLALLLLACVSLVGGWIGWKTYSEEQSKASQLRPEGEFNLADALKGPFELGPVKYAEQFLFMARATLMLGPTDNQNGVSENALWSSWQLVPDNLCGAWDGVYSPEADRAKEYLTSSCRSHTGQRIFAALREPGLQFYKLCSLAFLVFPIYLAVRRRWRSLLILTTPLWFLIIHAGRDYSNDRYGIPLYPIGLTALAVMSQDVVGFIGRYVSWPAMLKSRRRSGAIDSSSDTSHETDAITPVADQHAAENSRGK